MANVTRKRPPSLLLKVGNPVFGWLLARGKGPTSDMMLLSWRGRKSGRQYSTPVSRFEPDGQLFTTTSSPWRHNFAGGHAADVVLDGRSVAAEGTMVDDPATVGAAMRRVIDEMGDSAKRAMAIRWETDPTAEELASFAEDEGIVLIELDRTG